MAAVVTVQNWIPTFLASFGGSGQGIAVTGGLSSIPWIAAAVVGPLVGQAANSLIKGGVLGQLAVRRLMQVTCFLGCAASVVPLALVREPSVGLAVACLTGSLALYRWAAGSDGGGAALVGLLRGNNSTKQTGGVDPNQQVDCWPPTSLLPSCCCPVALPLHSPLQFQRLWLPLLPAGRVQGQCRGGIWHHQQRQHSSRYLWQPADRAGAGGQW